MQCLQNEYTGCWINHIKRYQAPEHTPVSQSLGNVKVTSAPAAHVSYSVLLTC